MAQKYCCASKIQPGLKSLFAAWFDGGLAFQIIRKILGIKCFNIHLNYRNKRTSKIGKLATAPVHDGSSCDDDAAVVTDDLNRFLDAPPAGDDILGNEKTFSGLDLKTAS